MHESVNKKHILPYKLFEKDSNSQTEETPCGHLPVPNQGTLIKKRTPQHMFPRKF